MNENGQWLFSTTLCTRKPNTNKPLWQGWPILSSSAGTVQIMEDAAKKLGMDVLEVLRVQRSIDDAIIERLKRGQNVNMNLTGYRISLTGTFDGSDDSFDPKRNALQVGAYAKPPLHDCLSDITPRNVTHGLKATIFSVQDNVAAKEGVITVARKVLVAGTNICMGNAEDEWCGLFTKKGKLVARANVLRNDSGIADLSFDALPADGNYYLTIFARNGASEDHRPATARYAVKVMSAN